MTLLLCAAATWAASQHANSRPDPRKPMAFSGRVESIDLNLWTVAIKHGSIPGFMPAMIMDYPVDDDAVLTRLAPGDNITATVYAGDPTLHDVHVVRHNPPTNISESPC
jgi:Cu/Ag efflux protein CusF